MEESNINTPTIHKLLRILMDSVNKQPQNDNNIILIERFNYSHNGTFGVLTYKDFKCYTVEQPWNNNKPNESCIPDGEYITRWHTFPTFGKSLAIEGGSVAIYPDIGVERSAILFHVGNWPRNFSGCIGLGREYICLSNELGVTTSANTIKEFYSLVGDEDNISLLIKPVMGTKYESE